MFDQEFLVLASEYIICYSCWVKKLFDMWALSKVVASHTYVIFFSQPAAKFKGQRSLSGTYWTTES
jgi:hypothetical protein